MKQLITFQKPGSQVFNPKKIEDYVEILADKYNLPKSNVRKILLFGMKNIIKMIQAGEDIRIPKFGNIYFDKKTFSNYNIKGKKDGKKRIINKGKSKSSSFTFSKSSRRAGHGGSKE